MPPYGLLWYKMRVRLKIQRGENRGRYLTYFNIVKELKPVAKWSGTAVKLALNNDEMVLGKNEHCIAFLQMGGTNAIIGAAEMQ